MTLTGVRCRDGCFQRAATRARTAQPLPSLALCIKCDSNRLELGSITGNSHAPTPHPCLAGSTLTAAAHIITAVIGVGVVALPRAFAMLGW